MDPQHWIRIDSASTLGISEHERIGGKTGALCITWTRVEMTSQGIFANRFSKDRLHLLHCHAGPDGDYVLHGQSRIMQKGVCTDQDQGRSRQDKHDFFHSDSPQEFYFPNYFAVSVELSKNEYSCRKVCVVISSMERHWVVLQWKLARHVRSAANMEQFFQCRLDPVPGETLPDKIPDQLPFADERFLVLQFFPALGHGHFQLLGCFISIDRL